MYNELTAERRNVIALEEMIEAALRPAGYPKEAEFVIEDLILAYDAYLGGTAQKDDDDLYACD